MNVTRNNVRFYLAGILTGLLILWLYCTTPCEPQPKRARALRPGHKGGRIIDIYETGEFEKAANQ